MGLAYRHKILFKSSDLRQYLPEEAGADSFIAGDIKADWENPTKQLQIQRRPEMKITWDESKVQYVSHILKKIMRSSKRDLDLYSPAALALLKLLSYHIVIDVLRLLIVWRTAASNRYYVDSHARGR